MGRAPRSQACGNKRSPEAPATLGCSGRGSYQDGADLQPPHVLPRIERCHPLRLSKGCARSPSEPEAPRPEPTRVRRVLPQHTPDLPEHTCVYPRHTWGALCLPGVSLNPNRCQAPPADGERSFIDSHVFGKLVRAIAGRVKFMVRHCTL